MKTLKYEIKINAAGNAAWNALANTELYELWVKAFPENSYLEGEWKQKACVEFPDPDIGGTKSVIEILEPARRILAHHVSVISKEGEESTKGEMASNRVGTTEEYDLTETNNLTVLVIELSTHLDLIQMLETGWAQALSDLKELGETNAV